MKWLNRHKISIGLIIVLLITLISYSGSIRNGFIKWDDPATVVENKDITKLSIPHIEKYFTSFYVGMYQPITTLSYAVEYSFIKTNPHFYHLTNLLFHLLNTLLVFLFIRKLSGNYKSALFVSMFFGIHPMHVESVCWVSERKDVLYTFFILLSLICYLNYLRYKRSVLNIGLCLVFFILSLLSKSAAVILPLLLILMDYYFSRKYNLKNLIEKSVFIIISIGFGIISLYSQGVLNENVSKIQHLTIINRLLVGLFSLGFYLVQFFIPGHLSLAHPFPHISSYMLPLKYNTGALAVIILVFAMIIILKNKYLSRDINKDIVFGLFFFLIPILLVLQIPVSNSMVAERYTYLPYIGLLFILGQIIFREKGFFQKHIKKRFIEVMIFLSIILFSVFTFNRTSIWKDNFTINDDIINKYPDRVPIAYNQRGLYYYSEKQYQQALTDFNKALIIDPSYSEAYNNSGLVKLELKDYEYALIDFNESIKLRNEIPNAYLNRAIAEENLKDLEKAILDLTKAIQLDRDYTKAYQFRGDDRMVAGDYFGAINDYTEVLHLTPENYEIMYKRGIARYRSLDIFGACNDWKTAQSMGNTQAKEYIEKYCQ